MIMVMEGSKMFKTEYDHEAIIYSANNTPYKVHNISDWMIRFVLFMGIINTYVKIPVGDIITTELGTFFKL